jgi:uncharacterized protein YigA (DUF484 family)
MAKVQEQAIEWLRGQKSMQNNPAFFEQASSFVPTISLNRPRSFEKAHLERLWARTQRLELCRSSSMEPKRKNNTICRSWPRANGSLPML